MPSRLYLEHQRLSLEHDDFYQSRDFGAQDRALLQDCATRYYALLKQRFHPAVTPESEAAQLLAIGQRLYDWLDSDGWLRQLGRGVIAPWLLEIGITQAPGDDETALLNAPWELLADGGGHLALNLSLRYSPLRRAGTAQEPAPASPYRLNLLFMAAAPQGQRQLSFEAEESAILQAAGRNVELSVEESGVLGQLADLAAHEQPDVLHLSCHGGYRAQAGAAVPVLFLEDDAGAAREADAADLITHNLNQARLLFLSACHSADPQFSDALSTQLLSAGFPALLGWAGAVSDAEASRFAEYLYQFLGQHQSLENAVAQARFKLLQRGDSRDWHLARLFLGPRGGGVLSAGSKARRLTQAEHGAKQFLDTKGKLIPVASRHQFVGRRRQIQAVLREFQQPRYAGILIHGMGRQGKSSLAARIANRLPDHQTLVVFKHYRAEDILRAFSGAGLGRDIEDYVQDHAKRVRDNPDALSGVLQDLLNGDCAQDKPVLLVIDDLEQILAPNADGPHQVRAAEAPGLSAVLEAFNSQGGDSRLLLTSRYRFSLKNAQGRELSDCLLDLPLPSMDPIEQKKQWRQVRKTLPPELQAIAEREEQEPPMLARAGRCLELARGNPGLQDLLYRLALSEPQTADQTLDEMQAWLQQGTLPRQETLRAQLENLVLRQLYDLLNAEQRELLDISALFRLPLPLDALRPLGEAAIQRLLALGLWDGWPDACHLQQPAAALNPLAFALLRPFEPQQAKAVAVAVVPPLARAWRDCGAELQAELARLAVLAEDPDAIERSAGEGVYWIRENRSYTEAAALGEQALSLLTQAARPPPVTLDCGKSRTHGGSRYRFSFTSTLFRGDGCRG